jgi:hypothetical protein
MAKLADYPPVHGAVVSLAAASVGLVVVEFVVLVVWTADTRSVAAASSALRVGADLWLLSHGSALELANGRLEVLPFGLALLPVVLAASAGHRLALARRADPADPAELDGSPRQRWRAGTGLGSRGGRSEASLAASSGARRSPLAGGRPGIQRRSPGRLGSAAPLPKRVADDPRGEPASWRTIVTDVAAVTGPYVALVCVVAVIASDESARPAVLPAVLATALLVGAGATTGVLRGSGGRPLVWRALPRAGRDVVTAGAAGAAAAIAVASVMFVVLLAARFPEVAAATRDLDAGLVGGAALFVGQAVVLPNVVWWAAAYALGPGTATGGGGVLRPAEVDPARLPDLPLFAALPTTALPASAWLVLALVPAVAGVVVALFTRRSRGADRFGAQLVRAVAGAAVCGAILGVGAHLSGASSGATRIGPDGQSTGLAAVGEVALAAFAVLAVAQLAGRRQRAASSADATLFRLKPFRAESSRSGRFRNKSSRDKSSQGSSGPEPLRTDPPKRSGRRSGSVAASRRQL